MKTACPASCSDERSELISTGYLQSLSLRSATPRRVESGRLSSTRASRHTRPRPRRQSGASPGIPAAFGLSGPPDSWIVPMWRSAEAARRLPALRLWRASVDRISGRPTQRDAYAQSNQKAAFVGRRATPVPRQMRRIPPFPQRTLHFLPYFSTLNFPLSTYFCTLHFCTLHFQGGK